MALADQVTELPEDQPKNDAPPAIARNVILDRAAIGRVGDDQLDSLVTQQLLIHVPIAGIANRQLMRSNCPEVAEPRYGTVAI